MGKVTVRIRHVTWRDGRPRFIPGTVLRAAGFKGRDLRHPSGQWFSLAEAITWSDEIEAELAEKRAAAGGRKVAKAKGKPPELVTLGELIEKMLRLPKYQINHDPAARAAHGIKAPNTVRVYRTMAKSLAAWDEGVLWDSVAAALDRKTMKDVCHVLVEQKGLSMANGIIALLRLVWHEFGNDSLPNPFDKLNLPKAPPRVRAGEIEEMEALLAVADEIGRPDIGDSIMLGLMTGQRQCDRIHLVIASRVDGELHFRQQKTGAIVQVPAHPTLEARLSAARVRRGAWEPQPLIAEVLADEVKRRAWPPDGRDYRDAFAAVRDAAAARHPSLRDFRDQDLRDTAVTWLGRAGCTVSEICGITGHSEASATQVLRHYMARHPEMARSAMRKVSTWLTGKGALQ
jgi:hypothetical protein